MLNAANEVAVDAFLNGRIGFDAIHRVNAQTLAQVLPPAGQMNSINDLLDLDRRARDAAGAQAARLARR